MLIKFPDEMTIGVRSGLDFRDTGGDALTVFGYSFCFVAHKFLNTYIFSINNVSVYSHVYVIPFVVRFVHAMPMASYVVH